MTIDNYKGFKLDSSLFPKPIQEIDYKELINKYFLNKWYWYAISLVVFLGAARFYAKILEPQYEIKSKLLIIESDRESYTDDLLKRSINFSAMPQNVYNEIQVLTSFALINGVVKKLNLDVHYFWKNKLVERDGYGNFPVTVDFYELKSPEYQGIPFEIRPIGYKTFELYTDSLVGTYHFDQLFTNRFGSFCFQADDDLPMASESSMNVQFFDPNAVTESYLKGLTVDFIDIKSTTLELKLEDPVPDRGVALLSHLITGFHEIKHSENNKIRYSTLKFIDERLYDVGSDLRSIESSLENYKLSNNIASETTSDLQLMLEDVNKLSKEQEDLEVQMNILESTKNSLNNTREDFDLIPINVSSSSTQIQEMIKTYNDLVMERRERLVTSQRTNPIVQSLEQRLVSLKNSIILAISNFQNDLRLKSTNVKSQYDRSLDRLKSVPTKERQIVDRSRQQNIVENLYTYLLQKREETALSLISTSSNSLIIDPLRSSVRPVSPNKLMLYFAGSLGGMALPFLFISLGVILKDSVQSEEDLKEIFANTSVPTIGKINRHKGNKKKVVQKHSRTVVAERFRSLRTNLQFMYGENQPNKRILVTSSTSNEGKTFVATNLAVSFAMAKEKTIILDFDIRNPQMTKSLGEGENVEIGVGNYLLDEISNFREIIKKSETTPNLDYVTVGKLNVNPAEIILSEEKLSELFSYLNKNYTNIIIDSSPVGIVSDAILLNKYITNSLYVVREAFTKKKMLEHAKDAIEQDKLINPLLVLNGVRKQKGYGYYGV